MKTVFIDTGYLLALELANDQNHQAALAHWNALKAELPALVTSSYVFDEVVTFFNSRGFHAKAVEVGNRLLLSSSVQVVFVDDALFQEGWRYFQEHKDKAYSLTDCISFVIMEKQNIQTALAFDRHFAQAGFLMQP